MSLPSPPPLITARHSPDALARFAADVGGEGVDDAWGPWIAVGRDTLPEGPFFAPLADWGLVRIDGEEAARFLHGQITNDVEHLTPGVARWGGYCSAKGRLLATFRYARDDAGIVLATTRTLTAGLSKRLSMFVLRARARVTDLGDAWVLFGLCGSEVAQALARTAGLDVPAPDEARITAGAQLFGLPDLPAVEGQLQRPRWLLAVPADRARPVAEWLTAAGTLVDGAVWRRTEVRAGIPRIVGATVERFVPQMLNFESVDGVNFRKGCYPGQEVVARSQYLGKLKRRMYLARVPGPVPEPAADLFDVQGGDPCGQVVLAAPAGSGQCELLIEAQTTAVEAGPIHLDGRPLDWLTLPYTLKAID